jgi:thiamine monophosphate synthase
MFQKDIERYYCFIDDINNEIKINILKFRNISLIFKPKQKQLNSLNFIKIKNFCKKNNIKLYGYDNHKIVTQNKLRGLVISSNYKRQILNPYFKDQFKIIGIAHNQIEYFNKYRQGCSVTMLSPLFFNKKFSLNKILGPTKFRLITSYWKTDICALGGLNLNNSKKLKLIKLNAIGFYSMISDQKLKKPVYFLR